MKLAFPRRTQVLEIDLPTSIHFDHGERLKPRLRRKSNPRIKPSPRWWMWPRAVCWRTRVVAITLEAIHAKEVIEQALAKYGAPEIVNTDQGSQFTAEEFTRVVLEAGCKLSMDGRGAGRDNVFVEACGAA